MPISFALRTLLAGAQRIRSADLAPLAATIFAVAAGAMFVVVAATGRLPDLPVYLADAGIAILTFSVAEAVGAIAMIELVRHSGSVFAGQKSFTTALGGVIWSIILLGATITLTTAGALLLLLIGLLLVARRPSQAKLFPPRQMRTDPHVPFKRSRNA